MIYLRFCGFLLFGLIFGFCSSYAGEQGKELKGTFSADVVNGKWTLTFDGKGAFLVKQKGEVRLEGTYKITNDHIEVKDTKGQLAKLNAKAGIYTWKVVNDQLTFTLIDDDSKAHQLIFAGGPWTAEK